MKKNNLLLLDVNNMLYISAYSVRPKIFKGKQIAPFIGFFANFCSYVNQYEPQNIICCFDYSPYERKTIYPNYKEKSSNQKDKNILKAISQGRNHIREFLNLMNISIWEEKGLEADDMIAIATNKFKNYYTNVIVCSNDSDLYQLLDNNIIIQKTKGKTYTKIDFMDKYPTINIKDWDKILSLAGTHNNIIGIEGIGVKTATKKFNDSFWNEMLEKYPLLETNKKLIHLPLRESKENLELKKPSFSIRIIINWILKNFGRELKQFHIEALNHLERL